MQCPGEKRKFDRSHPSQEKWMGKQWIVQKRWAEERVGRYRHDYFLVTRRNMGGKQLNTASHLTEDLEVKCGRNISKLISHIVRSRSSLRWNRFLEVCLHYLAYWGWNKVKTQLKKLSLETTEERTVKVNFHIFCVLLCFKNVLKCIILII